MIIGWGTARSTAVYVGLAIATFVSDTSITPPPPAIATKNGYVDVKQSTVSHGHEWKHALPSVIVFNAGQVSFLQPIGSPPGPQEFYADGPFFRVKTRLDGVVAARIGVNDGTGPIGSPLGSVRVAVQYSLDDGASWADLGPFVDCDVIGLNVGDWASIANPAKTDVTLSITTDNVDGVTSLLWYLVYVEFSYVLET